MRFFEPIYFLGFLLLPLLGLFFWWSISRKKKILARFGEMPLIMRAATGISFARQGTKAIMLVTVIFFLVIAATQPQMGTHMEVVKREGVDIFIAIDVSRSMDALDVRPGPISRLDKAKLEIASLFDPERMQGDRVGLIAFAGEAFIQCPLTIDYAAARMFLDIISTEIIPVPGTAIGDAIRVGMSGFSQQERKHKVLILLTDGEDHGTNPIKVAEEARKEGIKIYTIGVGNIEGEPIPIYNRKGERIGFKKDEQGEIIVSRMDESTLQTIALATGGKYYRASPSELELDKIYDDISKMEKKELEGQLLLQYDDRFQWPLFLAMIFMVWEVFVPERKKLLPEKEQQ